MQTKEEKKKKREKKKKKKKKKKASKLRAEGSGHCSSRAPAAQAHWLAWRPAQPSRRHCWKRSRPALRVPSVVLSSAARYSLLPAPGPGSPPPLPRRLAPGGVRGVAGPSRAPVPSRHAHPRGDWGWASCLAVGSVSPWPGSGTVGALGGGRGAGGGECRERSPG